MPMSCLAIYRLFAPQDHKGNKLLKPKQCLAVKASGPCLDLDINLARSLQHRDRPEFHYYLYLMEWPEDAPDDLLSTLKLQTERQILWLKLSTLKRDFWQTTPDLTRAFAGQSTRLYCFPTSTKFAWRCSKTKNSMTSSTTFIPLPTNGSTVYHTIVRRRTSRALLG